MPPDHGGEKLDSDPKVNQSTCDAFSEQPYPIRRQFSVLHRLKGSFWSHVKSALTSLVVFPAIILVQGALSLGYRPKNWKRRTEDRSDFMGVAVALHSCDGPRLAREIEALGVRQILLRFAIWEMDRLEEHWGFVESLPDCEFLL
ncbi:MAG: hypothetical protein MKZ70_04710 [Opitutales bacterium]|nr:hypothetical protein [Opitutales bacterium]